MDCFRCLYYLLATNVFAFTVGDCALEVDIPLVQRRLEEARLAKSRHNSLIFSPGFTTFTAVSIPYTRWVFVCCAIQASVASLEELSPPGKTSKLDVSGLRLEDMMR